MKKIVNVLSKAKGKVIAAATTAQLALNTMAANAIEDVKITTDSTADPFSKMGRMIGLLLTVVRYVGVAMAIYGVVEFVQGITVEGQMEKKTKGIIWVFAGMLMILAKWILGPSVLGVVG